ncbi:hypothetical protein H4R34_001076 [Dimargaris verticillata]|uniref:Uncharacterized protein n=1 Tax=Dimargaris verticillata TaxID=2761393 RepID=A0A9W8B5F0_9FUNG|nr:hypothetical protein H4R34_001076 [Dimargaris verticillata]
MASPQLFAEITPDEAPPAYTPYAGPDEQVVEEGRPGWNNPPRHPQRQQQPVSQRPPQPPRRSQHQQQQVPYNAQPISYAPLASATYMLGGRAPVPSLGPSLFTHGLQPGPPIFTGRSMPWCWKCSDTGYKKPGKPCNRCPRGQAIRLGFQPCPQCLANPRDRGRGPCPGCGQLLPPPVLHSLQCMPPIATAPSRYYTTTTAADPQLTTSGRPSHAAMTPRINDSCYLCESRRSFVPTGLMSGFIMRNLPDHCPNCNAAWVNR